MANVDCLVGHRNERSEGNKRQRHEAAGTQLRIRKHVYKATLAPRGNRKHLFEANDCVSISEDVVDKDQCVTVLTSDCAMLSFQQDPTIVLDTGSSAGVQAVAFHTDEKHVLGGSHGIRRWQVEDGQEVGKQLGKNPYAISVSKDRKWIVCATEEGGADVWDAEMQEKVVDVEGGKTVMTVDVSPDSTMFATGTGLGDDTANVWSLTTGKRLVGPLKHDNYVTAVRFSPNGASIATANYHHLIRVFDSRNGGELITIETVTPTIWPSTPIAWSNDSGQIFVVSKDNKIKSFDVSTGSQLAESQTLSGGAADSIALAANGKCMATFADNVILFLDASTLSLIGPVIRDSTAIFSIALSPNGSDMATGLSDGKISIRYLGGILPDSYGPFHVSIYLLTVLACQISLRVDALQLGN